MWKNNLITIITVTYNSSEYLERSFKSVFSQSYPNIEYIVIDGGSTDGTVDLIKKYQNKIKFWISEPDKGIYDAMNKGLFKANGEIIYFLNADDYFYDNKVVEDIVTEFKKDKNLELVYGNVIKVIEDLDIRFKFSCTVNRKNLTKPLLLPQQAFFYKKSIFKKLGKFDISYKGSGDYEFLCRMYTGGIRMKEIDREIVFFRKGGVSSKIDEGYNAVGKYFGKKYSIWFYIRSRIELGLRFMINKLGLSKYIYKILYRSRKINQ